MVSSVVICLPDNPFSVPPHSSKPFLISIHLAFYRVYV